MELTSFTNIIGGVAATLTTLAFVPQAFKICVEKQTAGISYAMYSVFFCGVACWLAYGLLIGSTPIIAANTVTLALSLLILFTKYRLERRK